MVNLLNRLLQILFFLLVVRPVVLVVLGLNVRNRALLPDSGPAIIVANHNSHLDTLVLMNLFPLRQLPRLRPVAAADYFLRSRPMAWFATKIAGIIPLARAPKAGREDPLAEASAALEAGSIVILFPEGSRGEPERLSAFKTGVAHLAKRHPAAPIIPVYLHGLGKALPRGEILLVPFFCDVFVGEAMAWTGNRSSFMTELENRIHGLAAGQHLPAWE